MEELRRAVESSELDLFNRKQLQLIKRAVMRVHDTVSSKVVLLQQLKRAAGVEAAPGAYGENRGLGVVGRANAGGGVGRAASRSGLRGGRTPRVQLTDSQSAQLVRMFEFCNSSKSNLPHLLRCLSNGGPFGRGPELVTRDGVEYLDDTPGFAITEQQLVKELKARGLKWRTLTANQEKQLAYWYKRNLDQGITGSDVYVQLCAVIPGGWTSTSMKRLLILHGFEARASRKTRGALSSEESGSEDSRADEDEGENEEGAEGQEERGGEDESEGAGIVEAGSEEEEYSEEEHIEPGRGGSSATAGGLDRPVREASRQGNRRLYMSRRFGQ
ncbi:hypothetical protein PLESTF_001182400 [Pleodorina starrii]|nr:hypothetical protein PLESTF_001182400 [Pleodorina starrii]